MPSASPIQQPQNMLQPMEEMILPPKRQAVVDRLRRRIETYRRRQSECVPRFDQSFTGACEQQNMETTALQKRFLEGKAKRQAKKTERKPDLPSITGNLHSSVHVQQKFGCGDYEPPTKLQCGVGAGNSNNGEALTKFSVEIVQQLEFTTSAADSQPQQISTNVTVKANAVKTSSSPPPPQQQRVPTPLDCERECKAECKSEVADDEFVDLDECAAAIERDGATSFPGLADLIGEEDGDDITSFEDLISEISEYPEFMKDFDLAKVNGLEPPEGEPAPRPYNGEMSPAAQTLKHMAEQHQQASSGNEWARYRYGGANPTNGGGAYRSRAPGLDHLHMSQHQQVHINQPHPNLQVSAAQHMQVSGNAGGTHVSVAAQQGMYASFGHQNTPSPQHHQGPGCDSYSVSQTQSMNFSQMRQRPTAPSQNGCNNANNQQQPLSVAAAGISREQQAKMLQQQQQQMLRAQQMRPPPPEYKARFLNSGGSVMGARRAPAQNNAGLPRGMIALARPYSPEWRHVMMQQQTTRHQFQHHHQGGFGVSPMGGVMSQQQQMQIQQARLQQQQMMQHQNQQRTQSQQQSNMSHLLMQQNQMMNVQGQMPNIHMSQNQSMSMGGGMGGMNPMQSQNGPMQGQTVPMQGQNGPMQNQNAHMQNQQMSNQSMHQSNTMQQSMMGQNGLSNQNSNFPSLHNNSFTGQTADFNLDFLDNMPSTDASNLTAQELLNSLDNSFLNDIL